MGNVSAVIVAAGKGKRMGGEISKQFLPLLGKPILLHSLDVFEQCGFIDDVYLVIGEKDTTYIQQILQAYRFSKVDKVVVGGTERQHSVYNGLKVLSSDTDIVLIHDGARPFVSLAILEACIDSARKWGSGVTGVPSKDTVKVVDGQGYAVETPDRSRLWMVQTPQCFQYPIIMKAHEKAMEENYTGTDDAVLVERLGLPVKMVMGSYENIKVTTPEDLLLGEVILKNRQMNSNMQIRS